MLWTTLKLAQISARKFYLAMVVKQIWNITEGLKVVIRPKNYRNNRPN